MLRSFVSLLVLVSFALETRAANVHWRPQAAAQKQRTTATFAGTYSAGDLVTITVGNGNLVLTVGTDASTTAIAADVKEAINASDTTSALGAAYQRTNGGQSIPEFTEILATVSGSIVTIYSKTPGKPITIAMAENAAAGYVTVATPQAATGPNHFDNAANWSGGAVPVSGDVIYFDSGSIACKYGLAELRDNTKICAVIVTTDFTGQIGLDYTNADGANRYVEYRDRYLELYDPNDASPTDLTIQTGVGGGAGGRYLFDLQSQAWDDVVIRDAGTIKGAPSVELHGGAWNTLYVGRGWVAVDPDEAGQTAGATIDAVTVGKGAGRLTFGPLTRWATAGTPIGIYGGTVIFDCPLDTGVPAAAVTVHDGTVELRGDGDLDALTICRGRFIWSGNGAAQAAINVWGKATLDLSQDSRPKTFNGITLFAGATLHQGGQTPVLTFSGGLRDDCTITE